MAVSSPQTVTERAYRRLRTMILNGRLKPGEYLRQQEFAKRLKVSVNTFREVLYQLEHDGLVEIVPRWGGRVAVPDRQDLVAHCELRAALECEAARLCGERATDEELGKIVELARDHDEASEHETAYDARTGEMDFDVHRMIVKSARSPQLYSAWRRMRLMQDFASVNRIATMARSRIPRSHSRLAEAIRTRNVEQASAAAREHVESSRKLFIESMKTSEGVPGTDAEDDWLDESPE